MTVTPEMLQKLAENCCGELKEVTLFPDGHGCAIMEIPLPKDHWIYQDRLGLEPPAPFRIGEGELRSILAHKIREAGKYALLSASQNADEVGFDPNAYLQNLVVGLLGYWTEDGLSHL